MPQLVCRPANSARLVDQSPSQAATFVSTLTADLLSSGWPLLPKHYTVECPVRVRWLMAGHELPGGLAPCHRPVVVDVETSIEIECPRSVVAAFASNPDNAARWYANIRSINWETTPPAVVGSRVAFVAQFLGRRIAYTYEVREIAPGERFVMGTAQAPFRMQTTYSWHDTESGGTRMTLRNSGEPSGFGKMAAPMMAAAMRKANQQDLARLKTILETKS